MSRVDRASPRAPSTATEHTLLRRLITLAGWTLAPSICFVVLALPAGLTAPEMPYFFSGAFCAIAALFGFDSPIVALALLPVAIATPVLVARLDHARGALRQRAVTVTCFIAGCLHGVIGLLIAYGKHV